MLLYVSSTKMHIVIKILNTYNTKVPNANFVWKNQVGFQYPLTNLSSSKVV
jgi:hypothetical protein